MESKSDGQVAYEAYCNSTEGKSLVSGAVLPHWKDVQPAIKAAWEKAAEAVLEVFINRQAER